MDFRHIEFDSRQPNLIAVNTFFQTGQEISRTITIPASNSGDVSLLAQFFVMPSEFSDVFEKYEYSRQIEVTVI